MIGRDALDGAVQPPGLGVGEQGRGVGADSQLAQPGLVQGGDLGLVLQLLGAGLVVFGGQGGGGHGDGQRRGGDGPALQERPARGGGVGAHASVPSVLGWWNFWIWNWPAWRMWAPIALRLSPSSPQ